VRRKNGQLLTGYTRRFHPLDSFGGYYHIMMDEPYTAEMLDRSIDNIKYPLRKRKKNMV